MPPISIEYGKVLRLIKSHLFFSSVRIASQFCEAIVLYSG